MPTHFHFLIRIKESLSEEETDVSKYLADNNRVSRAMQILQSSYTKAFNKRFDRSGSLFQPHFKAKLIQDEDYFAALVFYIHQNPVRSKLVENPEEWKFSSYQDYINLRNGSLPQKKFLLNRYSTEEIRNITNSSANSKEALLKIAKQQMSDTQESVRHRR